MTSDKQLFLIIVDCARDYPNYEVYTIWAKDRYDAMKISKKAIKATHRNVRITYMQCSVVPLDKNKFYGSV